MSALVHFLVVETLPLPVAVYGFLNVHINIMAQVFINFYSLQHVQKAGIHAAQAYYLNPLLSHVGSHMTECAPHPELKVEVCYAKTAHATKHGLDLGCNATDPFHYQGSLLPIVLTNKDDWQVLCCLYIPLCVITAFYIYSLLMFAKQRVMNFRIGKYLAFTWDLERNKMRRRLSIASAVTSLLSVLGMLFVTWRLDVFWDVNWSVPLMNCLIVGMSLRSMKAPTTPVPHWSGHATFEKVVFNRPWTDMFAQANEQFAAVLQSALFSAKVDQDAQKSASKNMKDLRLLVSTPSVEEFLRMAQTLEEDEDSSSSTTESDAEALIK
eukprot:TRINITY_DN10285_c0_g1_i1.p1 TRINITY_DN10285_c0_g1~~TRINITY_DN10285_c0_g1_i1.p1  ORF type:complete len:324 (-),score=58.12 TRINITY_DN10285_c0_g1_i1:109-1080(-)